MTRTVQDIMAVLLAGPFVAGLLLASQAPALTVNGQQQSPTASPTAAPTQSPTQSPTAVPTLSPTSSSTPAVTGDLVIDCFASCETPAAVPNTGGSPSGSGNLQALVLLALLGAASAVASAAYLVWRR